VLRNIDEENEGYTYMSRWFNVFCTRLVTFGKRLTLDDVVTEDEATQTGVVLLMNPNHLVNWFFLLEY
jgi:hypothetical protein